MGTTISRTAPSKEEEEEFDVDKQGEDKATEHKYPVVNLDRTEKKIRTSSEPEDGFATNKLKTSRYTPWNFIPKNLFEQFRRTSNLYFTLIVVIAFIPQISPVSPWTGVGGLTFVLVATAINEGYLDYKRYKSDKKMNEEKFKVIDRHAGKMKEVASQDIRVGDLLLIESDETIPADIVILATSMPHGVAFIETAQLDGETNLKDRNTIDLIPEQDTSDIMAISKRKLTKSVLELKGTIEVCMPNTQLDNFQGTMRVDTESLQKIKYTDKNDKQETHGFQDIVISPQEARSFPLGKKQLALRGSHLRNTHWIIGIAVYCGPDTKFALNQAPPTSKFSSIDIKMNKVVTFLFVLQVLLCITTALLSRFWEARHISSMWYLGARSSNPSLEALKNFFVYFVLLSWIIPLSLFVSLEIVKVVQAMFIEWDDEMKVKGGSPDENTAKVRNNGLNDELGLVKYIFSDKTGTLTENVMKFKKASIGGRLYTFKQLSKLAQQKTSDQGKPFEEITPDEATVEGSEEDTDQSPPDEQSDEYLKDFLLCLSLCHKVVIDVVPPEETEEEPKETKKESSTLIEIKDEPAEEKLVAKEGVKDPSKLIYKGPSPDEEALVNAARSMGYILKENRPKGITLEVHGELKDFETLRVLEFSGERKRMSVIVKDEHGRIILYSKGADTVMLPLLDPSEEQRDVLGKVNQHMQTFSEGGLRTLVMAKRELSQEEFEQWDQSYEEAEIAMENRKEKLEKMYEEIEKNLKLLGCTAIEDKLQEGVPETIQCILSAGIRLWVITGDKQETAINIGRSSNMIPKGAKLLILNADDENHLIDLMENFLEREVPKYEHHKSTNQTKKQVCLVTDGNSLKLMLKNQQARELFLQLVEPCTSVICCRVIPLVKAKVVKLIRHYTGKVCLSIGDGANDVSMIQEASIGVGLFGKEGTQAARSADYAIRQFKHITRLLFVHGRYSIIRNSSLIHFSIYKNCCFALGQYWFAFYCGFSGQRIYNDWMMLFFNIFFTSVPVLFCGIFEKDLPEPVLMTHPELFKQLRTGYLFNYKTTLLWFLNAVWHSLIVFFVVYLVFTNDTILASGHTADLWSFGYAVQTFAVLVVLLRIAVETKYWVWPIHVGIWGSVFVYFVSITIISLMINQFSDDYFVFETVTSTLTFWAMLLLVIVMSLSYDFGITYYRRMYYPLSWNIFQEKIKIVEVNGRNTENSPLLA